jgi:ribosomal protein S21
MEFVTLEKFTKNSNRREVSGQRRKILSKKKMHRFYTSPYTAKVRGQASVAM